MANIPLPSGSLPSPPKIEIPTFKQIEAKNLEIVNFKNKIQNQLNMVKFIFKAIKK